MGMKKTIKYLATLVVAALGAHCLCNLWPSFAYSV